MPRFTALALAAALALVAGRGASAESCRFGLPEYGEMDADDAICYFVRDLQAYRQLEAMLTLSIISAAMSGVSSVASGVAASQVDGNDIDALIQYHQHKEAQYAMAFNAQVAAASGGSMAAQMGIIKGGVMSDPLFVRYRDERGLTNDKIAFRLLNKETKKLWRKTERKAVKKEQRAARKEEKRTRKESRQQMREYRRSVR